MKRSTEPFWWSIFSAGGVMAALFMPAIIVATGFILPFAGDPEASYGYDGIHKIVSFWLVRLALFGVMVLAFFHCAHRVRHILMDVGLRRLAPVLMVLCYGGALVGAGIAGWILLQL